MTPPVPASDLWGFLPRPVAVVLAILIVGSWVLADLTGKLKGPINWLLTRRERATEALRSAEQAARTSEHGDRDRRVTELKETLDIVDDQLKRLSAQVQAQAAELRILHKLQEDQSHAIRTHTAWDNAWLPKLRLALPELEIPDPPSLYVTEETA